MKLDPASLPVAERSAYQNGYEAGRTAIGNEMLIWLINNLLTEPQLDVIYKGHAIRCWHQVAPE